MITQSSMLSVGILDVVAPTNLHMKSHKKLTISSKEILFPLSIVERSIGVMAEYEGTLSL